MNTVFTYAWQVLAGLAFGGAWAYVNIRLGTRGTGLVEQTRGRRRQYAFYGATWMVAAWLQFIAYVWRDTAPWTLGLIVLYLSMSLLCAFEVLRLGRLLNHPLIYLVALRDEFGGRS